MKTQATRLYPFVPSGPQFARSLEFFAALGFETKWRDGGLAGLRFGAAYFLLQEIDVPEWQKNQMITFEVTDLDVYWSDAGGERPGKLLSPACASVRPRSSPGVARSTSSILAESAGMSGRRKVRKESGRKTRNSRRSWWTMRATCSRLKPRSFRL